MRRCSSGLSLSFLVLLSCLPNALPGAPPSEGTAPQVADNTQTLPGDEEMKRLAKEDPVAFLEKCLRRYQRDIKGYRLIMEKQERIGGELRGKEIIEVWFREEPYSVCLRWLEGARRARNALYVDGENNGMLLVRPTGLLPGLLLVEKDPEGDEARDSARYSLKEFGFRKATERVLKAWKAANDRGELFVEFLGEERVEGAGNRVCYVLKRSRYQKPEADGVLETTLYVDKETWLQVGSVLRGKNGERIASYFFRDIQTNPVFRADQFRREGLQR